LKIFKAMLTSDFLLLLLLLVESPPLQPATARRSSPSVRPV